MPAPQTSSYLTVCGGFAAGLTGTVGYTVYSGGSTYQARTTAGITELPSGSGQYQATVSIATPGAYVIVWDDASGRYASENINVVTFP